MAAFLLSLASRLCGVFHGGSDERSQQIVAHRLRIEKKVQCQSIEQGTETCGVLAAARKITKSEFRQQFGNVRFSATQLHGGMDGGQALLPWRPSNGIQLEFDGKQHAPAIPHERNEQVGQRPDALSERLFAAHRVLDALLIFRKIFLKNGEKDIFFVCEVCVERTAGFAGGRGDVFQARHFEAIAGENVAGRLHQFATGRLGALLAPRAVNRGVRIGDTKYGPLGFF